MVHAHLADRQFIDMFIREGQTLAQIRSPHIIAIYDIGERSLRQMSVPSHLLGRANATTHVLVGGLSTIGMLIGGILGQLLGIRPTVWFTTLGPVLALLWIWLSPVGTLNSYPEPSDGE